MAPPPQKAQAGPDEGVDPVERALAEDHIWYHTMDLAPGRTTPGQIDMRSVARRVLPDDLSGLRALDVGSFDGFWSFEMEARGAEVVAIDVESIDMAEWPPLSRARLEERAREWDVDNTRGFRLASEAFGSRARWVGCNVYDLEPVRIGGPVDLAFVGSILLHLRDPVRALERVRETLEPGGRALLLEPISLPLTLRFPRRPAAEFQASRTSFNWWYPNLSALKGWMWAAGFADVRRTAFARPPARRDMRQWHAAIEGHRKPC